MLSSTAISPFNWWRHTEEKKYQHMYAEIGAAKFSVMLTQKKYHSEEPVEWIKWCVNNVQGKFSYNGLPLRGIWYWRFTNEDDAIRFKLTWG